MNANIARVNYLRWLSEADPALYRRAIAAGRSYEAVGLGELGWINLVIQAVGLAAGAMQQKKAIDKQSSLAKSQLKADIAARDADREAQLKVQLLEVNTARAKAGLPPVDITGKVIPGSALPVPAALSSIVPQTLQAATWIPGVPNYATALGGAVLLLFGLKAAKVF